MSKNTMAVMQERDLQKTTASQRIVQIAVRVMVYAFLIAMAVVVLFPFYWMIISSLKTLDEYRLSQPTFFPQTIMFSNYADAFTTASLGRLFINTMIVGVASTLLSLVITVLSAFAFARLEFKGRELLFSGLLATMMIPGELFTITNFVTVTEFGWRNTYTVLIVPFLVSVFYIFLLRQNFMQIYPNYPKHNSHYKHNNKTFFHFLINTTITVNALFIRAFHSNMIKQPT
jgi:multiple sugar transport system permease protein